MSGKRFVFLGPPGAGKGTQAVRLARDLGIPHVSTGEILRSAVEAGSPLGRKAKAFLDSGRLVPDDVICGVVAERLERADCAAGFLLDGFPRTVPQASMLEGKLAERGSPLTRVLLLDVPDEEVTRRLLARGRSDDARETIRTRIETYHRDTEPLAGRYRSQSVLTKVDGTGTPDAVHARLLAATGAVGK